MQDFDFILLLNKRFSGEISVDESMLLDDWIAQSSENAQLAEQYQAVWNNASRQPKIFKLDMDAEYQSLQTRLGTAERPAARVIPLRVQLMRVAAALAFLLFAVWGYRQIDLGTPEVLVEQVVNQPKRLIELPDGTRVWLRQSATLERPAQFTAHERRIKLNGEAYFEVAHKPSQPFRIELPDGGLVEVLGTRFNIQTATETSVLVRDGKVRYAPDGKTAGTLLTKNKKAVFNKKTAQLRLSEVATFNELAWQTGGLEFVHTPLSNVISDLETYYQVKIELQNPALQSCFYTAPLTNQPLQEVLEVLSITFHFKISNPAPGRYILMKGRCR